MPSVVVLWVEAKAACILAKHSMNSPSWSHFILFKTEVVAPLNEHFFIFKLWFFFYLCVLLTEQHVRQRSARLYDVYVFVCRCGCGWVSAYLEMQEHPAWEPLLSVDSVGPTAWLNSGPHT